MYCSGASRRRRVENSIKSILNKYSLTPGLHWEIKLLNISDILMWRRLLSGYPAESVVIARKSKDSWYISGLNGTENTKSFRVNLEFIKDSIQLIQLFSDTTDGKQIKIENSAFDTKELNIECQPRGGFVVWVKLRK